MAIIRFRDENGEVKELTALRGEKGDKGERGDYVLVVTEKDGVTSHSASEIKAAYDAGSAVFLYKSGQLIGLTCVDDVQADFYHTSVGFNTIVQTEYYVNGNNLSSHTHEYETPVDTTLSKDHIPADAKTVGERFATADRSYANVLKGTASGEIVRLDDVSPLEQELTVRVSADTTKLKVYGKNLLPFPYHNDSATVAGITYTVNDDGSFTVSAGTATSNANWTFIAYDYNKALPLKAGTYTFSIGTPNTELIQFRLGTIAEDGTSKLVVNFNTGAGLKERTFTLTEDSRVYMNCIVGGGTSINETTTFYPMLEVGTSATEFESPSGPTEYTPNEYGEVEGVTACYPVTTLTTDAEDGYLHVEYNKDTNKVVDDLLGRISALEAAVVNNA